MSWGGGSLWERTRSRGVNPHTYQQRRSAHVALIRKGHRRVDLALAPGSFAAESGNCSFFCACYRWSAARVLSYATVKPSIYLKNTQRPSATQLTHMCSNFSPVSITATEKQYCMEEAQASKDVIHDAIYIRREAKDFFYIDSSR